MAEVIALSLGHVVAYRGRQPSTTQLFSPVNLSGVRERVGRGAVHVRTREMKAV